MRRLIVFLLVFISISLSASRFVEAHPDNHLTYLGSTGGITQAIDIAGQYAYVGEGLGLSVLNISDPEQPVVVGRTKPFAIINKLVVSGDYVYAAVEPFGDLWIIDVSDPTEPALVTSDDSHWVWDLSIDGSYLYAATFGSTGGLHIYDLSNPAVLQEVGYLHTTPFGWDVEASGGIAYVTHSASVEWEGGLWIVDVSDPTDPFELARIGTDYTVEAVAVAGDYIYTAYANTFRIIDIRDPANPVEVGTVGLGFSGVDKITLSGEFAYLVIGLGDIVSIDISNPVDPQLLSVYRTEDHAADLAVAGQYLYYTDRAAGIWVMDVTDPANPVEVGSYNTMDQMTAVVAGGDYAYVADREEGLMVVDVSDPALPQAVGFYNSPNDYGARSLALDGNYVYLAAGLDGLCIVDVSDPAEPVEVAVVDQLSIYDVALQDGYAYIISNRDFSILDVSDPTDPTEVATYDDLGWGMDAVQVSGGYAYIASGLSGFRVLDISDPLAVTQVGYFDTNNRYAVDVALMGDYAVVAVRDYYVLVLDVSDPAQIAQVGSYSTVPRALAVEGNLVYIAGGNALEVIDFSNPGAPILVDSVESFFPGSYSDVYLRDGQAYVTGTEYGLLLYDTRSILQGDRVIYLPVILR